MTTNNIIKQIVSDESINLTNIRNDSCENKMKFQKNLSKSFWDKQPMWVGDNLKKFELIQQSIGGNVIESLPDGFNFKNLSKKYYEDIFELIKNHYLEDEQEIVSLFYSKEYIYWYLSMVPDKFCIGLIYKTKIVGIITAILMNTKINDKNINLPYVNLFCLQKKIRKLGFGVIMMNEIKNRLSSIGLDYCFFTTMRKIPNSFCTTREFIIPINLKKLREIGFLQTDFSDLQICVSNPLRLATKDDTDQIIEKLNKFMENYKFHPIFDKKTGIQFLIPKKEIIYSYIIKNDKNEITDFISVYKYYYICKETNKILTIAQLGFYFYTVYSLTELVIYLLDKLKNLHFDQLMFRTFGNNLMINHDKFLNSGELNYYMFNCKINHFENNDIIYLPI